MRGLSCFVLASAVLASCRPGSGADVLVIGDAPGPEWHRPKLVDAHAHLSPFALPLLRKMLDDNGIEYIVNLSGGNQADEDLP